MNQVAASEFDLLTIARALVDETDVMVVQSLLRQSRPMPGRTLGPTAIRLLEQTLSRGVVLVLAKRGGWRRAQFLGAGAARDGRMWERHPPTPLPFSPFSMRLLQWLTREPVESAGLGSLGEPRQLLLGDELLLYLAADLLYRADLGGAVTRQRAFQSSALCWLFFPDLLAEAPPLPELSPSDFAPWTSPERTPVLEALQPALASRWTQIESSKGQIRSNQRMMVLGTLQDRVLRSYFRAVDRAGRRDLAGFCLTAAATLLHGPPSQSRWTESLSRDASLSDRSAARRAAASFLRLLETLANWNEEHRSVRFFDDEYDAAQLLLRQFEAFGEPRLTEARALVRSLESLQAIQE